MYCRGSIPPFFAGLKLQYLYIGNSGLSAGNSTNTQGDRLPVFASFDRCITAFNASDIASDPVPAHAIIIVPCKIGHALNICSAVAINLVLV